MSPTLAPTYSSVVSSDAPVLGSTAIPLAPLGAKSCAYYIASWNRQPPGTDERGEIWLLNRLSRHPKVAFAPRRHSLGKQS